MFFHPALPADLRPRVEAVLAERDRIAGAVRDLRERIAQFLDPHQGEPDSGPESLWTGSPVPPGRPAPQPLAPLPDGWITDTEPVAQQFRAALATAIRRSDSRTRANAALLRYGLGRTRRPLANPEVAQRLGISVGRAQQAIMACVNAIHLTAVAPLPSSPTAHQRASLITAHLARQILGDLDLTPHTANRIRGFIDQALPDVDAPASTRLLLRLAGQDWQPSRPDIQRLIRMVKAITPDSSSAQNER
jgi:hypothetical protein